MSWEGRKEGGRGGDFEVHVRMADGRDECYGGRRVRVGAWDLDVDLPLPAFVRTALAAFEHCEPVCEVVFGDGGEGGETGVWFFAVAGELFDEALADGGSGGGGHCVWGYGYEYGVCGYGYQYEGSIYIYMVGDIVDLGISRWGIVVLLPGEPHPIIGRVTLRQKQSFARVKWRLRSS